MYVLYIRNSFYTPCLIIFGNKLIKGTKNSEEPLGSQKSQLFLVSRAMRTGSLKRDGIPITTRESRGRMPAS